MKRFRLRYLSVLAALCVMLIGAAIAAASPGDRGNSRADEKTPDHVSGRVPSHAAVTGTTSPPGLLIARAPLIHSARQAAAATQPASHDERRYQWTGEVRSVNDRLVLYRGCDRWILDPESREIHRTLQAHVDGGRVDVWGHLSSDARQTVVVHAVYGPDDPRPRVLVPDYPCPREQDPAPKADWVSGWVGDVDLEHRVIVLRLPENGPMRFLVTDETAIVLDGEPARLGSLQPGMAVRIAFEPRTQNALRVMAASERPAPQPEIETIGGIVSAVDVEGMTLALRLPDGSDVKFRVTPDTYIALDGERVRLGALEPRMRARVSYEAGTRTALRVMAVSQRPAPQPEIETIGGTVSAVDVDGMTLALLLPDGSDVEFRVTPDTYIALDGERVRLGALEPRMLARVSYEAGTRTALRIMAVSQE